MSSGTGYNLSQYLEKERERQADQPLTGGCTICGLTWKGTVAGVLEISKAHREKEHPETLNIHRRRRRSARALHSFRTLSMDAQSKEEIEADRRKRAHLHGVEIVE